MLYWSRRLLLPLWHTHLFVLIWWGTQEPHQGVFFFFSPFVPLLLSAVVCQWFIVSNCKTPCKAWTLGYISWEQGETLLSTCHGAVCNRIPETQWGRALENSQPALGPPSLTCPASYWSTTETPGPLHSPHLHHFCCTIPTVRQCFLSRYCLSYLPTYLPTHPPTLFCLSNYFICYLDSLQFVLVYLTTALFP